VSGNLESDNGHALVDRDAGRRRHCPDAGLGGTASTWRAVRPAAPCLPNYRISHIEFDNGVYAVLPSRIAICRRRCAPFLEFLVRDLQAGLPA